MHEDKGSLKCVVDIFKNGISHPVGLRLLPPQAKVAIPHFIAAEGNENLDRL